MTMRDNKLLAAALVAIRNDERLALGAHGGARRQTLASHGCCSRGRPGGR